MGLENTASSAPEVAETKPTQNTPSTQEPTEPAPDKKLPPVADIKDDEKRALAESEPSAAAVPGSSAGSEKRTEAGIEKQDDLAPLAAKGDGDVPIEVKDDKEKTSEGEPTEPEDESKYPGGLSLFILTAGLCVTTFMIALDNSIIATAIPRITTQFNSIGDVGWYGSSYLLTQTSLQPSFGKIYTYYSIKWTFLIAMIIFEVGSVVCAAAPTSTAFIIGRSVAGVGAAALFSGGMTIIGYTVPLRKRALYIAALSSMFGIASVVGPLLGGVFTDAEHLTWRWCFWINLPIGGAAFAVVFFFFGDPDRSKNAGMTHREKIGKIDILGAAFLISAVVCLLLALQWGGFTYPWKDSKVWGCLLGFGLLIIIFIGIQWREQDLATIPPRIFLHNRTVLCACLFNCFLAMAIFTHIFFLPFYFQAVLGTTAVESGIRCIPYLVSVTVASLLVGGLVTVLGVYTPFMWASGAVFTVGAGLLHTLKPESSSGQWIGYQILSGFGAGMGIQIPFIAVQVVLSKEDMPLGNALAIFFNSLGGAISISIAQNIFTNTLLKQIPIHAPEVEPELVIHIGASAFRQFLSPENLPGVITAYNIAITTCFILAIAVGVIAFLSSLGMEWKSIKGKKLELAAAG